MAPSSFPELEVSPIMFSLAGAYADVYTSAACVPAESYYAPHCAKIESDKTPLVFVTDKMASSTFADIYTSAQCEPIEAFYFPRESLAVCDLSAAPGLSESPTSPPHPIEDKRMPLGVYSVHGDKVLVVMPHHVTIKGKDEAHSNAASFSDIYSQPDCVPVEVFYMQEDEEHHRTPRLLGAFSVHGIEMQQTRTPAPTQESARVKANFSDIYTAPDCVPVEVFYTHPQKDEEHRVPRLLGAFSVHGIELQPTRTPAPAQEHKLSQFDRAVSVDISIEPPTASPPTASPPTASPLCAYTVHGTCVIPTLALRVSSSSSPGAQTLKRTKSWKDMSLDNVVEQALFFQAPSISG